MLKLSLTSLGLASMLAFAAPIVATAPAEAAAMKAAVHHHVCKPNKTHVCKTVCKAGKDKKKHCSIMLVKKKK
jgi:hypothetical protein